VRVEPDGSPSSSTTAAFATSGETYSIAASRADGRAEKDGNRSGDIVAAEPEDQPSATRVLPPHDIDAVHPPDRLGEQDHTTHDRLKLVHVGHRQPDARQVRRHAVTVTAPLLAGWSRRRSPAAL
jgi:hypothetical protein